MRQIHTHSIIDINWRPLRIYCEQPIVKYCNPDGSVSYVPGQPQIAWYGVPGATGYLVEVTYGSVSECCSSNHLGIDSFLVSNSPIDDTNWRRLARFS
ncbi:MAG: hypothetical protein R2778_13285 [Saprospiraceae bacterium]